MPNDYWVDLRDNDTGSIEKFRFIGGPIELPNQCGNLFHLIGHFAASWARMEQHIDAILIQINKKDHSDEIDDLFDPRHPGNFDQKLRLLRRYFRGHPVLTGHTKTINILADGLKKHSSDRNNILHGILEDYLPGTDPEMILHGVKPARKGNLNFRRSHFPLERLQQLADLINTGHYALCDISKELFTEDAVARLQRPRQPIRHRFHRLRRWLGL